MSTYIKKDGVGVHQAYPRAGTNCFFDIDNKVSLLTLTELALWCWAIDSIESTEELACVIVTSELFNLLHSPFPPSVLYWSCRVFLDLDLFILFRGLLEILIQKHLISSRVSWLISSNLTRCLLLKSLELFLQLLTMLDFLSVLKLGTLCSSCWLEIIRVLWHAVLEKLYLKGPWEFNFNFLMVTIHWSPSLLDLLLLQVSMRSQCFTSQTSCWVLKITCMCLL